MKTILILTPCYDEPKRTMGSVPKLARQLSRLARVVVLSGGSSTRVEDRTKRLRVYFLKELLIPDPVNNGYIPLLHNKLRAVLRKEKPDVVLNVKHMFQTSLLVPYLRRSGYRVITATDTWPGITWFPTNVLARIVVWLYARTLPIWALRKAHKVILYHDGLVPTARKLSLAHRVIANGVEFEMLDKAKPKKLAGKINVLYVGRLESVKGYKTICEAMRTVTEKNADIHFYHLGDDRGKESFTKHYAGPQMHFEGRKHIEQVYEYMKGADIIVLASKSEGLPNTIMEGMAAGCVPVSTPVGAVPALLENGSLGKLFAYGDARELARHVTRLAHNPKERLALAKRCAKKIRVEYNWEKLAREYYAELFPRTTPSSRREVH